MAFVEGTITRGVFTHAICRTLKTLVVSELIWSSRLKCLHETGAATCDLNHIMMSCTHFGERPSVADITEMKDGCAVAA